MIVILSVNSPICHKRKRRQCCKWVKIGQEQKGKWRCRFCVVRTMKGRVEIVVQEWELGHACDKQRPEKNRGVGVFFTEGLQIGEKRVEILGMQVPTALLYPG